MATAPEIPPHVIGWLQQLGSAELGNEASDGLVAKLRPFDQINRLPWTTWDAAIAGKSAAEMEALAKGAVLAERENQWCGGSVGAAIWIYRHFERCFPEQAPALAEWMLQHSDNFYVPFGSNRGTVRTLAGYRAHQEDQIARRVASATQVTEEQEQAGLREAAHRRIAAYRREVQTATALARRTFMDNLRQQPLLERLDQVAWDDSQPLEFYPPDLLEDLLGVPDLLRSTSFRALVVRAKERRTGPWASWFKNVRIWLDGHPDALRQHDHAAFLRSLE